MIKYTSERQLSIEEFKTPFQAKLLADNRWVQLSKIVPWNKFASAYMSMMTADFGRPGISPRIVLGALIIKHLEKLDDRGVISAIQENIYMQYFIGLKEFTPHPVFDPSLFVDIRKRVGHELFDTLNEDLIKSVSQEKDKKHNKKKKDDSDEPKNKGEMQADATVADQYITYPTDNGKLNQSRKKCEKLIDKLYEMNGKQGVKTRTYRRMMDKAYLVFSKKKKKTKAQIEFGPKLGVSLDQSFARINTFSWDAYHESGDLKMQVEAYKEVHGHYPELTQVDKIYATHENRRWLKERGIRITAPPLGRKRTKTKESYYQRRKARKEAAERNHIEGKFGQGKNGYNLNEIRARLKDTSESWVACIFFVMNLIHYEKISLFGLISRWFDALLAEIATLVRRPELKLELKYRTEGKSGRLQFC